MWRKGNPFSWVSYLYIVLAEDCGKLPYVFYLCVWDARGRNLITIPYSLRCPLSPIFRCFSDIALALLYLPPARMKNELHLQRYLCLVCLLTDLKNAQRGRSPAMCVVIAHPEPKADLLWGAPRWGKTQVSSPHPAVTLFVFWSSPFES